MTDVIRYPAEMSRIAGELRLRGNTIGFVPTMGALHEGHVSLIRRSVAENDVTVVSVFVNPTQFGPGEDYEKYPRTLDDDVEICVQEGVDFVFAPQPDDMYPRSMTTWVEVGGDLVNRMCGLSRPGHFRGVATVCAKLFNIVRPHTAYFGQKDYQQYLVVRRLVEDLNFPMEIALVPIVREKDGLARSSRNRYLRPGERESALSLYRALTKARDAVLAGETDASALLALMASEIESAGAELDYAVVADPVTLEDKERVDGPVLLAVAAWVGDVRLIDNFLVDPPQ